MAPLEAGRVADHGGSLDRARMQFPGAPEPWIDLSTGVNPHSYPLFPLPATALTRLPEPADVARLAAVAAHAYGAASEKNVVAAPGTQILLPLVAALVKPGRAAVLAPTYAEHARAAGLAGHAVIETDSVDALAEADLAVIVNPNNPDGRTVERSRLLDLAAILRRKGGLLVVDEAFMDVGARGASLAADAAEEGIVVLKSFGKFFGLAGVRLGFAIASAATARRLDDVLGPWAVSGPALDYGLKGLADSGWQQAMRERLAQEAAMLDALLLHHGIAVSGGTPLFRFVEHPQAGELFHTLGEHGILVRRFDRLANCLRFGLPAGEAEMARLDQALTGWSKMRDVGR